MARVRRVERDPHGGWIARRKDGSMIYDADWRWNTRSGARHAVIDDDLFGTSPTPPRKALT